MLHSYYGVLLLLISTSLSAQTYHQIPTQELDLLTYIGRDNPDGHLDTVNRFAISSFITYGQYKAYLADIKRDSSWDYYVSQRPDSSILPTAEQYAAYVDVDLYNDEPVMGISWDNAINYCIWKTRRDNPAGEIGFIYRLPSAKEWVAALYYLELTSTKHDLNHTFADWLLDAYYVNRFDFWHEIEVDTDYARPFAERRSEPSGWQRKITAGNSYLFSESRPLYLSIWFFQYKGHRHLGFRLVKEYVTSDDPELTINQFIQNCVLPRE